jgi:hypothetical protein
MVMSMSQAKRRVLGSGQGMSWQPRAATMKEGSDVDVETGGRGTRKGTLARRQRMEGCDSAIPGQGADRSKGSGARCWRWLGNHSVGQASTSGGLSTGFGQPPFFFLGVGFQRGRVRGRDAAGSMQSMEN